MSANDVKVRNEALRSRDSATFTGSLQTLGTALGHAAYMIKFKNDTNRDVTISYDGTTSHDIVLEGDREVEDLNSNKSNTTSLFVRSQGTQVYVSGTAGTGLFYMTVIYADSP